jgi:hypothetical protein
VTGSTIESITTLGTFATPTATKCRFKEVDATNHKGLYEFQFANARFAISNAQRLIVSVTGAANLLDADYEIQLVRFDPYDAIRMGMASLPNAAAEAAGGLYTRGAGAGQINQVTAGMIDTNPVRLNNSAQSLTDLKDFADDGYDPSANKVQGVVLVDTLTTYTGNTLQTADVAVVLSRMGAFTGTGINTLLGFLQAIMRADAALTPSDVGGTFNNVTDSLEAADGDRAAIAAAVADLAENYPFFIV